MNAQDIQNINGLQLLHRKVFGKEAEEAKVLRSDGSARKLYRLSGSGRTAIGVFGPDGDENAAFLSFSSFFRKQGLPVPEIYGSDEKAGVYLEEDLGNTTLFDYLNESRDAAGITDGNIPESVKAAYRKALGVLPKFQEQIKKGLDTGVCYPRAAFDRQSIMWDLNYFKYYFLKLAGIPFNEQNLENDFNAFADFLLKAGSDFFLYRDFQSRNIMLRDGEPWFIDYQGGRRGARQYDLASLLFDAKANLLPETRNELRDYYIDSAGIDRNKFMLYYPAFVYVRIMQAMGAYGLRGFYERKTHFLLSVPYAVRNIEWLLMHTEIPVKVPTMLDCFRRISASSYLRQFGAGHLGLTIRIGSFSFKNGMPLDERGHGGGFIFDCRALPNPGRYERYRLMTGKDEEVNEFFRKESSVEDFLNHVYGLVDFSVGNYLSRNFTSLMVNFGCTGGQHRSVYCAERLAEHLKGKFSNIKIELAHKEIHR